MTEISMVPGSDPSPPQKRAQECMSCRVIGATVLTGTGLYTMWASYTVPDTDLHSASPSSATSSSSVASTSTSAPSVPSEAKTSPVVRSGRAMTPGLGLDTKGFARGPAFASTPFGRRTLGRGLMGGFGFALVLAGVARGYGVTHYDVLEAKDRFFGAKDTSAVASSTSR